MGWRLLADGVLAVHAAWVLFNVFGGFLCWPRHAWRVAHLSTLGLTLIFFLLTGGCPLTDLENFLLGRADPAAAYPGGFLAYYLERLVYWDVPAGAVGAATLLWSLLWAGLYAWLWRRERRGKEPGTSVH